MKRNGLLIIITFMLILSLIAGVNAFSYSLSIRTQNSWNPGFSYSTTYGYGHPYGWDEQMVSGNYVSPAYDGSFGMSGEMIYSPMRYGGLFIGECWDPYQCAYSFYANETQIAEVTGTWKTDLIGTMNIMLTGDDTIRGLYEVNGTKGYLEGNFTSNGTQGMEGLWWEEPSYQPPMSAGIISISFVNESFLEGVFSYPDGTWGPFTAIKEKGSLLPETEEKLKDMPEVNWKVNASEGKEYRVFNQPLENPVLTPAIEG